MVVFRLCDNAMCSRSGWCKRFTYAPKVSKNIIDYPVLEPESMLDCSENGYIFYVRNKAREIYERENPHDTFTIEESNRSEHENNNRESRMRQDDPPYQRVSRDIFELTGDPVSDRLLQFFASRSAGSGLESVFGFVQPGGTGNEDEDAVLPNPALNGFSPARIEPEQPVEGLEAPGVWPIGTDPD